MSEKLTMWAVMKVYKFSTLETAYGPLQTPKNGPTRFIPVFETQAQAEAWAGGPEHVTPLMVAENPLTAPAPGVHDAG